MPLVPIVRASPRSLPRAAPSFNRETTAQFFFFLRNSLHPPLSLRNFSSMAFAFPRFQNEPCHFIQQTLFLVGTHTKRGGCCACLPSTLCHGRNLYPVMFETGIYGVEYSCTISCTRHCAFGSSSHDRRNNWIDLLSLSLSLERCCCWIEFVNEICQICLESDLIRNYWVIDDERKTL